MKCIDINELSVEQKIGMLFVVRSITEPDEREFVLDMIEKRAIGGVQVRPNAATADEEVALILDAADYPILICADMEQGIPGSKNTIPSMMALGVTNNEELAYQFGVVTAIEAKNRGFNTVWGPCVDLVGGNGLCKVPRRIGDDPEFVGKIASAIMRGYNDNGMVSTAKHWPSGSDIADDGHMFATFSQLTEDKVRSRIFGPYRYAMEQGQLCGIMTNHTTFINIDETYPGTLSEKLISIVREEGFDGIIMTDSFAMMGVLQKFGEDKCYGIAIKAGNDMILPNYRTPFKQSYEYLLRAYREGVFSEERLNEAVRRVIEAQNRTLKPATATELSDYHKECIARIGRESICAVTDAGVSPALKPDTKKLFAVLVENPYSVEGGESIEISDNTVFNIEQYAALKQEILARYPTATVIPINQLPSAAQVEDVCSTASEVDEVIFMTYVSTRSYRASESLTEHIINVMRSMQKKISAVVHVGNPFAMEAIPHVPRVIFGIGGIEQSQCNALNVLAGVYQPTGKLPVKLNLK